MIDDVFNLPHGENRKPHQIALEWLLEQKLQPGDIISSRDIDLALCLVDPNKLPSGRKPQQKWTLARLAEWIRLRDAYEEATGEILVPSGAGSLLVCPHNEVAETLMDDFFATLMRLFKKTSQRLSKATRRGISNEELARRNYAEEKIAQIRWFATKERRHRLSDAAE